MTGRWSEVRCYLFYLDQFPISPIDGTVDPMRKNEADKTVKVRMVRGSPCEQFITDLRIAEVVINFDLEIQFLTKQSFQQL